ncbi:MAG: HesA/MoeB/ThiF family protein [Magnetococcus sp. DMHC-6]
MNHPSTQPFVTPILVIGAGALGGAVAMALVEAGVTGFGLADPDHIALSNLHRQVLYRTSDIGHLKVAVAAQRLTRPGAQANCCIYPQRLEGVEGIVEVARHFRVLVDGSDNFATRFAANDAALQLGIPLVHGAVVGFLGQVLSVIPGQSACLRCLFEGPPPPQMGGSCTDQGVLGSLAGEVGWLMAIEAIKLLRGVGKPLLDRLLTIQAKTGLRRQVIFKKNPQCRGCQGDILSRVGRDDGKNL